MIIQKLGYLQKILQKPIKIITICNFSIIIILLYFIFSDKRYTKEENKYVMLNDVKKIIDNFVGENFHKNYLIYLIILLHGLSGFGVALSLFFTTDINFLFINFFIQSVVLVTNLHYKGEKLVFRY